ncbi:hypothetical protein ACE38W_15755 [Chitinophaga sp. Hz27]
MALLQLLQNIFSFEIEISPSNFALVATIIVMPTFPLFSADATDRKKL